MTPENPPGADALGGAAGDRGSDRFDGRIVASPIPANQIAKRTRAFATAYAALLTVDSYSEQARSALRDCDDDQARHCLEVLRAIIEVAIAQLRGSSSEQLAAHG
jgi:hypothetical protein